VARSLEDAVEEMVRRGIRFEYVEDFIEGLLVPSEQKDALWLLAWAEQPRVERRLILGVGA
jgi:hypothetical protein